MVELGSFIGRVKWFNGNKGYGFITCLENRQNSSDTLVGKEVFVHHSSIHPSTEVYRTLVKGEYVQFSMGNKENKPDEPMAVNVTGILGNPLQCDVQAEERKARAEHRAKKGQSDGAVLVKEGESVPEGYIKIVPSND